MSEIDDLRNSLEAIYGLPPEQAVERLIGIYQHVKSLQSALDEVGTEAKERLSEIIAETGQTDWRTASGSCSVTRPGINVRYDRKGLDQLAANDPTIASIFGAVSHGNGASRRVDDPCGNPLIAMHKREPIELLC